MNDTPPPDLTVGGLLRSATVRLRAAGSETARLDAELLLGHALDVQRTTILAHPEVVVGEDRRTDFEALIERRSVGEPVAYLRGIKEFFGLALSVDRRALIPRPETERLVELALEHVRAVLTGAPRGEDAAALRAWDVGTGSGAIAVALAVDLRRRGYGEAVTIMATDHFPEALALAMENAVSHGVADAIEFAVGDLLEVPGAPTLPDLVVANLPYIPSADLSALPVAASFEPVHALDGGADGLVLIRRLLAQLPSTLAPSGSALLEIGAAQGEAALAAAAEALPGWPASIELDLGGRPRVLGVRRV
ncbi:MAG: peptide chain release factor N(5)-glutamine methyltransferase [Chloroflexota bacterium]|nr:peptide chain release factor N(5)-glutamine methyltransferase [Chloroflexota bacterium]